MTLEAKADPPHSGSVSGRLRLGAFRRPARLAVLGRFSWGLADQAVSSLTNVVINLLLVRTLDAAEFGAFGLAYVSYGFILNCSRGLATEPFMVRFSGTDIQLWRRAAAQCSGTALLVGLVAGVCLLMPLVVSKGITAMGLAGLGLTLPMLMLQDSWRYCFFALGKGYHAFLNDLTWAVFLVPSLIILRKTGHTSVFLVVCVWGASAGAAAIFGIFQTKVVPSLPARRPG